jgi:hypothetical protein
VIERRGVSSSTTLVDILDRVLDKGLVVAGDIRVSLANVELLTIQIRLLVCSIDKAQEIGLDWWRRDPFLSGSAQADSVSDLQARVAALERQLTAATQPEPGAEPIETTRPASARQAAGPPRRSARGRQHTGG